MSEVVASLFAGMDSDASTTLEKTPKNTMRKPKQSSRNTKMNKLTTCASSQRTARSRKWQSQFYILEGWNPWEDLKIGRLVDGPRE
jgi:hypothetical protein